MGLISVLLTSAHSYWKISRKGCDELFSSNTLSQGWSPYFVQLYKHWIWTSLHVTIYTETWVLHF
jgi:hypothetical protein